MKKRITQVDSDTGEVIGDFVAVLQPKRRNAFTKGWIAMSQEPLMLLAKQVKSMEDYRVLLALLAKLDWDNMIVLSQSELARELEMHRPNVSQAIRRLVDLGVIIKGAKMGVHQSYRLNPNYGWKGSAQQHHRERGGLTVIDGGKQ